MQWKKHKHIWLAFSVTTGFCLLVLFLGMNGYLGEVEQGQPQITPVSINYHEVVIQAGTHIYEERHYLMCNEIVTKLVNDNSKYIGLNVAQLLENYYLIAEGWQGEILDKDTIVFYQKIEGLCEKHSSMRHLKAIDNHVAIMYGPRMANGGIAHMTNIIVPILPMEIRMQIEGGLLEFATHEDALQALDTLDEYNLKETE